MVTFVLKQNFRDFIFSTNTDGSGKAVSYGRALDMLGPILTCHCPRPIINGTMWQRFSLADIQAIHKWICAETKKGSASPAVADFKSPSHWTNNFCSAAVLRGSHISPWAIDDYPKAFLDQTGYGCENPIELEAISSSGRGDLKVVTPRVKKQKEEQERRTSQKVEVSTPSWICNENNNLVDEAWFGRVE